MQPTLRQLEALVRVYRLGSITRAAAELGVTQSAVSLLIRQVEENFGLPLFDRTTRALHPTAACREAIAAAERILAGAQGLSQRMRDLAESRAGRISVAVSAGVAAALLPRVFAAFRAGHPDVQVDLLDVAPDALFAVVMAGQAEFGLGSFEDEGGPEVRIQPLMQSPLAAIGVRDGRFETHRRLSWDSVMAENLITMRRGTRIRRQIDAALAKSGRALQPAFEVSLITTALALSAEGAGLSILPAHMLPVSQFPTLAAVPLAQPTIHRHVSLLSRADFSLSPAAQRFAEVARRTLSARAG
jgi:DNA-binding transcriptional LysR family regulator